jgi:hypothetical protein
VPGGVTRGFDLGADPFAAGRHRGADFAAAPGTAVRAACRGRVVVAARIGGSGVVTVACGPWRVSLLPLARIAVRAGVTVGAGDPLGQAGASPTHAGVHLGVRRAGRRFGYVDPLRFVRARRPAPPGPTPAPAGRRRIAHRGPVAAAPAAAPAPAHAAPLAPWPAWAGLAALLLAAGGGGLGVRRAGIRRRPPALAPAPAREAR